MNTPPVVLILGARGRFGSAAARAFARAGWRVLGQVRPGATPPALPGVHWLQLEPADTAALAAAAHGACVVVHALSPAYTQKAWQREALPLAQAAIDVTQALGATLMLPGNVYNFGHAMPRHLREDTPQLADTVKGRIRVAIERLLQAATAGGRMKAVVIRAGDFFGSGTGSMLDLVIAKSIRQGVMAYPGEDGVPTAWAYLPDLARAFVRVAEARERLAPFETLHFAGYTLQREDWRRVLEDVAHEQGWLAPGAPLKVKGMPWPLLRMLALVIPTLESVVEMRYLSRTPHELAGERLQALVGPMHCTPFDQAVRASLLELGIAREGAPATATVLG